MPEPDSETVWELLSRFARTQTTAFTSQEAISWFRRHAPAKANERTVRTHLRGASWNVGDRSQFSSREPFLTRTDRGVFRAATAAEIAAWHRGGHAPVDDTTRPHLPPLPDTPTPSGTTTDDNHLTVVTTEWHSEAQVQSLLVTALATSGWQILSVANTATKEHGIDVIAARDGRTIGVEVKGFPSRSYADPARAGEPKRTSPSTQAGHWFAQAALAAMRLRTKEPTWTSVIALPAFPRYAELYEQTKSSLTAAQIEVWWVAQDGTLDTGSQP